MALLAADGTITLTTGAIGTTFIVSGLSFQPKAIILFWSGRATTGQGEADHMFGVGIATGTASRRSYTSQSDHGNTTMNTSSQWDNDCCVSTLTIAGALDGKADLDAILADGFRLIIDDVFSAGLQVGWIAYGGTDLTNAEIIDFVVPGATGNVNYATSFALNTGVDDKAVFFLGCSATGGTGVGRAHSEFMFGASAGNTPVNAVTFGGSFDNLATSSTASYCRNGDCIAIGDVDGIYKRASLTAWLSTGFTLNWAEVNATLNRFSALVLKGGRWQVGDSLTSTGTTNQTEATGYVPKALLIGSHGKAASTSDIAQAVDERIIGVATSATSRRCAAMIDKNAAATADIGIAYSDVAMYINQSTAATVVQEGAMDLVSFDATPGFTFVMDDADPVAAFFWYLLAADAPSSGLTVILGQASETDSAQSVSWAPKRRLIGQALETDIAQAIARRKTLGLGQAFETDTAGAVTARKTRTIGQAAETDLAQALTKAKRKTLGQATETDVSQAIAARKTRAIGQAVETDSAQPITKSGNKVIAVGQAVETDTAQALARIKRRAIAQVAETDTAQAIVPLKRRLIGQAVETDTALGATPVKRMAINQVIEIDSAIALTRVKRVVLGQVVEIDLAQAITRAANIAAVSPSATHNTIFVSPLATRAEIHPHATHSRIDRNETTAQIDVHSTRVQMVNRLNLARLKNV